MDFRKDYYTILGLNPKASLSDIKIAYKRLVRIHHPDKNPNNPSAQLKTQELNEAYSVLSNPIDRQVYDEYREQAAAIEKEMLREQQSTNNKRTYSKTTKKTVCTGKVFFKGKLFLKYWSEQEEEESIVVLKSVTYRIIPTETLITIDAAHIYNEATLPLQFKKEYAGIKPFGVKLTQPVRCRILSEGEETFYDLDIQDIRVKAPVITHTTKYDKQSLGTLEGEIFGYIVKTQEETVTEYADEFYGATGRQETKIENNAEYLRKEYYHKDGTTYWSNWQKVRTIFKKRRGPTYHVQPDWWNILILLLLLPFLLTNHFSLLLFASIFFIGLAALFVTKGYNLIYHPMERVGRALVFCLILAFFIKGWRSLSLPYPRIVKREVAYDSLKTQSEQLTIHDKDREYQDERITHFIRWQDYQHQSYQSSFSILGSALYQSQTFHQSLQIPGSSIYDIRNIYNQLSQNDTAGLKSIYNSFSTIRQRRHLDRQQFAGMIVSCIQSIPYYLVLPESCDPAAYAGNEYVQNYLSSCNTECCVGNVRYGVRTPLEFYSDLKGDCDTRSLLLYALLEHFRYDVALLVSDYYQHALIAVYLPEYNLSGTHINIKGKPYYLWETTGKGFKPGSIPPEYTNLDNWIIALISSKNKRS